MYRWLIKIVLNRLQLASSTVSLLYIQHTIAADSVLVGGDGDGDGEEGGGERAC